MKSNISSGGIGLTIIGVAILYWFSPLNESRVDGGDANLDHYRVDNEVRRQNRYMRVGVAFIVLGSIVQVISNYWPD